MIVKNEAPVIERCLASVLPIIDYWTICDTGSSDGTQEIIRNFFSKHDKPGELHERAWKDFAHNRGEALELSRPHADYSLIIDADDVLELPRRFELPFLNSDSYTFEIVQLNLRYERTQLVRNALPWKYEGVLHEFLTCGLDAQGHRIFPESRSQRRLPGARILLTQEGARRRQSKNERYSRDAKLLSAAIAIENDPFLIARYVFYLAQSYENSGQHEAALAEYLKRAELGFWQQEIFVSLYRAARLKIQLGHEPDEIIAAFDRAAAADPKRAEALHGAARYCRTIERYEQGFAFAQRALPMPSAPSGSLFIDQWIYDYGVLDEYGVSAYWTGRYETSLKAFRRLLLGGKLPASEKERIGANARRASEALKKRGGTATDESRPAKSSGQSPRQQATVSTALESKTDNDESLEASSPGDQLPSAGEANASAAFEKIAEPNSTVMQRASSPANSTKTIGLCMIVKNEAHVITRCLDSARPLIDYVLVEDTGSTDGTQEIIRDWLRKNGIAGEVVDEPWRDFAYNRSHALSCLRRRQDVDYAFIIDADDTLAIEPGFDVAGFKRSMQADLYDVAVKHGSIFHFRPHLCSNRKEFTFRGVLHEFLETPPEPITRATAEGLAIRIDGGGARSQDPEKFRKDALLLERALQSETDEFLRSRYTFYLAQSYKDCGEPEKALHHYLQRAELGFWQDEIFIALYEAAKQKERLGHPDQEVIEAYSRASEAQPARAEAIHGASRFCRNKGLHQQGYEIAKRGLELPTPASGLFVENWIYEYGLLDEFAVNAYWAGDYVGCLDACHRILTSGKIDETTRKRAEANARFAREHLNEKQSTKPAHDEPEDAFLSLYKAAERLQAAGEPFDKVIEAYERASDAAPHRAEALHGASRFCRLNNKFAEGYGYARRGLAISPPTAGRSVQSWIYDYGLLDEFAINAYWIERYEDCLEACKRLLHEGKMPRDMHDRVKKNAQFADEKMRFQGVRCQPTTEPIETKSVWVPATGTVHSTMTFFSQGGQDRFVYEHFFRGKRDGTFVDVGAYDGEKFSNSLFFERFMGWRGLCIEPTPSAFAKLSRTRKAICEQVCVADFEGEADFVESDAGIDEEMLSGLAAAFDPRHTERLRTAASSTVNRRVHVTKLSSLLAKYSLFHVDYCSIDIKGSELKVVSELDLERFHISVLTIGNNYDVQDLPKLMAQKGYDFVVKLEQDYVFKRRDVKRLPQTSVFCAVWHKNPQRSELLRRHSANLARQTVPVEPIYVFDGDDEPPGWLKGRAISVREPLTIYQAWNVALSLVDTPFVMNLNLDDRLCRDAVEQMESALGRDSEALIVGGDWNICYSQGEADDIEQTYPADRLPFVSAWPPLAGTKTRLGSGTGDRRTLGPATMWRVEAHSSLPRYPWRLSDGTLLRTAADDVWWTMITNHLRRKAARLSIVVGNYYSHPGDQAEFRQLPNDEMQLLENLGVSLL